MAAVHTELGMKCEIEKAEGSISSKESVSNLIGWDGPSDPQNPRNFNWWAKITNIGIVSWICLCQSLPTSLLPPAVPQILAEFQSDNILLATFVVTVNVLGLAFGPLFWAPMSEIYERMPVYHISNAFYFVFAIACAKATSIGMLIAFNFLLGVFGSVVLSNGKCSSHLSRHNLHLIFRREWNSCGSHQSRKQRESIRFRRHGPDSRWNQYVTSACVAYS